MSIDNSKLQFMLNTPTTDILISWNDTPTMRKLLTLLYAYGYNFVNKENYNINQSCEDLKTEIENDFYKWYHGNSKPILHIFYNHINGKNELQLTTKTIIRTYPQYKNKEIFTYFG
ncbi:MAG: hypothetical protein PUC23_03425 [bacterium]|nr:hypothetical protein [bacterium]